MLGWVWTLFWGSIHGQTGNCDLFLFFFIPENLWTLNLIKKTTLSDEEMTKIKVIDFDVFYNFYIHDFFSWNHLVFQILNFKNMETWNNILKEHMISNEKVINIKVVQLIKIYYFYFGHHSIWLCLNNSKFEFQEMTTSNNILKHEMISSY
jgi:hypothetical protein